MSDNQQNAESNPNEPKKTPLQRVKEQQAMWQRNRGQGGKRADSESGATGQGAPVARPKHGQQKMG